MKKLTITQINELQFRLSNDDQNALKELFGHYSKRLFHFAYSIIHSRELAEEIVEDVFIQVWQKRIKLSTLENLTWYLYVATRNISCNYLRKYKKVIHIDIDELTLPNYTIDATPEELIISNEALQNINKIINELPLKCRIIFKLVKEDGLKYKEVAGLLNLTTKTVENQMGIALKKLHAALDHRFYIRE
ncbi:MAG: RNA polymerase sigma-70 factor [Ginsengibacter sp.]